MRRGGGTKYVNPRRHHLTTSPPHHPTTSPPHHLLLPIVVLRRFIRLGLDLGSIQRRGRGHGHEGSTRGGIQQAAALVTCQILEDDTHVLIAFFTTPGHHAA